MTKFKADEYAILISAKLHALASSVSYGSSTKQSFGEAMVRIAQLSDAYEAVRIEDAERKRAKVKRPVLSSEFRGTSPL